MPIFSWCLTMGRSGTFARREDKMFWSLHISAVTSLHWLLQLQQENCRNEYLHMHLRIHPAFELITTKIHKWCHCCLLTVKFYTYRNISQMNKTKDVNSLTWQYSHQRVIKPVIQFPDGIHRHKKTTVYSKAVTTPVTSSKKLCWHFKLSL